MWLGGEIISPSRGRPYRHVVTLQSGLVAAGVATLGIALLFFGGRDSLWTHHQGLQAFINALGAACFVSVALGALWELAGKRAFAREILEAARTSTDVEVAGLSRVGNRYLDDPDWEEFFQRVRKLDIFVAYARTWRHSNLIRLQALAARTDARIRLYLPDPEDAATIQTLAERFSQPPEHLRAAIREATEEFEQLRRQGGAEITVYVNIHVVGSGSMP